MPYPKIPYVQGRATALLHCARVSKAVVSVRRELPGNIIVIHGVNDVGTSFAAVEQGLCQGLNARMHDGGTILKPASYRLPATGDKDTVDADPDAIYFKRRLDEQTNSPVIPFYWGYRERSNAGRMVNGQTADRYGNRLDKDMAKNGGPFGNATNSLPDMWNKGLFSPLDLGGDAVRPLMTAPGRMYMVLAAKRLAALIAMIRDYDPNDTVSIVAHSQGCLISLLAQAFLFDEGKRPADTLILTHPPYSLVEDTTMFFGTVEASRIFGGGKDAAMRKQYHLLDGRQTLHARLQTLAQIVQGVFGNRHDKPTFASISDHTQCHGMAGSWWKAEHDRDNRGKVYLYFCPEDMTVALDNMQGIGWQGVPDYLVGHALTTPKTLAGIWNMEARQREPLSEIGPGFFQRVFTNKLRIDPATDTAGKVLVGQAPHDFALRLDKEDDHAHAAGANRGHRGRHDKAQWPPAEHGKWSVFSSEIKRRKGLRRITGEALRVPSPAVLDGGQIDPPQFPATSEQTRLPKQDQGPCEELDPIDAAIAVTSSDGLRMRRQEIIADPRPHKYRIPEMGSGFFGSGEHDQVERAYNLGKDIGDQCKFDRIYRKDVSLDTLGVNREETPNEARRRWQNEISAKSFHGAIIGNAENHRHVTAYDVAIGGGKASSDPLFYQYLCAVADWRLQHDQKAPPRPTVLRWERFLIKFGAYWNAEPAMRKQLIEGSSNYYSDGILPAWLPGLKEGMPSTVVCETLSGHCIKSPFVMPRMHRPSDDIPL